MTGKNGLTVAENWAEIYLINLYYMTLIDTKKLNVLKSIINDFDSSKKTFFKTKKNQTFFKKKNQCL
ncbi:hypothetical protein BpHYR1_016600, partial [Brachionus plicatilis]